MADINCFSFTGRLTKDATVKTLQSGKKVLVADVAINTGFGDFKKTLYIKAQQWGDKVDNVLPYMNKGTTVGGYGELSRNEWGDEGNKKVDFVVDVRQLNLISTKTQTPVAEVQPKLVDFKTDEFVF